MKQENNVPLYKRLNNERTQTNWETTSFKEGDFGLCMEDAGDGIAEGMKEKDAEYTALAVNNLHLLAEAATELLRFESAFRERTEDALQYPDNFSKAVDDLKEALKAIS